MRGPEIQRISREATALIRCRGGLSFAGFEWVRVEALGYGANITPFEETIVTASSTQSSKRCAAGAPQAGDLVGVRLAAWYHQSRNCAVNEHALEQGH